MSYTAEDTRKVVPAQLGFLAIYNPSLGTTDETLSQQIVYYYSTASRDRQGRNRTDAKLKDELSREEDNEQLRQIGLAQGMVEFGRSFSDGTSVGTIETEKSKIILHELESGWWILASVDLTRLPSATSPSGKGKATDNQDAIEYSSREVKPAILLLGDLLRAHATFLLHHASSMSALFVRTRRSKFIGILSRYWDTYLSTWNVLMQGNPANNLYGGIKIAACGELGVGVGEEERGSGEREVLEGFVGRIEGLVDIIVSKFGDVESNTTVEPPKPVKGPARKVNGSWLGTGEDPTAEDGAIFLGKGALSRKSLRDVSHWVEDLYKWGPYAYGVIDNPSSNRQTKPKLKQRTSKKGLSPDAQQKSRKVYGMNSLDGVGGSSRGQETVEAPISPTASLTSKERRPPYRRGPSSASLASVDSESKKGKNKLVQYLKMGYGTHWSLGSPPSKPDGKAEEPNSEGNNSTGAAKEADLQSMNPEDAPAYLYPLDDSGGHYMIGLMGGMEEEGDNNEEQDPKLHNNHNDRILVRTLTVELERAEDARPEADISIDLGNNASDRTASNPGGSEHTGTSKASYDSGQDRNKTKKLRAVVYVNKPFVFVLLFELRTDALALNSLYHSLHRQIEPILKPLLRSTRYRASRPELSPIEASAVGTPIYDLVWDPRLLTINSTIPNIPNPYQIYQRSSDPLPWSRIEALNTHMQIINTYIASTNEGGQMERTCKTSRGWWVVWTLIPEIDSSPSSLASGAVNVPRLIVEDSFESVKIPTSLTGPAKRKSSPTFSPRGSSAVSRSTISRAHPFLDPPSNAKESVFNHKEIFLIRRASDNAAAGRFSASASAEREAGASGKLAQGIGVDTKRYIEALLNISR